MKIIRLLTLALLTFASAAFAAGPPFAQFVDPNPSYDGFSNRFGETILPLSTGNVVITSPGASINGVPFCGAVYLFNGATGALISTLYGTAHSDWVGSGGVQAVGNGNFVVRSPYWDHGSAVVAGAVTWGSGTSGVSGPVSAGNSLVGSTTYDSVGSSAVVVLANGHYVVPSPSWDNGAIDNAGSATWGDGNAGVSGAISASNSLVGNQSGNSAGSQSRR